MTTVPFFDRTEQCEFIRDELDTAAARMMKSDWFTLGPEVAAVE